MRRALLALAVAGVTMAAPLSASAEGPDTLIVGGEPAVTDHGAASLHLPQGHLCSGTVVAPTWVLTAGHCAFNLDTQQRYPAEGFTVRAGTTSLWHGPTVGVTEVVVHPGFDLDPAGRWHDIALLHLKRPVHVAPVPIGTAPVRPGTPLRVLGFGVTRPDGSGVPAQHLRKLDSQALVPKTCATGPVPITAGEICVANPPETSVCHGDSGGPSLRFVHGRWELVGASTCLGGVFGTPPRCGAKADIYTDVTAYQQWVHLTIARRVSAKTQPDV